MKQNERINIDSVCKTYQDWTGENQQYCTSNIFYQKLTSMEQTIISLLSNLEFKVEKCHTTWPSVIYATSMASDQKWENLLIEEPNEKLHVSC
jgi:hypothetical protein